MKLLDQNSIMAEAGKFTQIDRENLKSVINNLEEVLKNQEFNEDNLRKLMTSLSELVNIQQTFVERLFYVSKRYIKI